MAKCNVPVDTSALERVNRPFVVSSRRGCVGRRRRDSAPALPSEGLPPLCVSRGTRRRTPRRTESTQPAAEPPVRRKTAAHIDELQPAIIRISRMSPQRTRNFENK